MRFQCNFFKDRDLLLLSSPGRISRFLHYKHLPEAFYSLAVFCVVAIPFFALYRTCFALSLSLSPFHPYRFAYVTSKTIDYFFYCFYGYLLGSRRSIISRLYSCTVSWSQRGKEAKRVIGIPANSSSHSKPALLGSEYIQQQ